MDDFGAWQRLLADDTTASAGQPDRISHLCAEALSVTGAGISAATGNGHSGVVAATDDVARRIEELQVTLGEGPCVDAASSGAPVLVPDLEDTAGLVTERWPGFLTGAIDAGARAVFALPLRIGAIHVGGLDLYRDTSGELPRSDLTAALMAADVAAISLLHLDDDDRGVRRAGRHSPTGFAAQVHQATGMVKEQLGVAMNEAFLALRARAFSSGRPLADVAAEVVERRLRFTTEDR